MFGATEFAPLLQVQPEERVESVPKRQSQTNQIKTSAKFKAGTDKTTSD